VQMVRCLDAFLRCPTVVIRPKIHLAHIADAFARGNAPPMESRALRSSSARSRFRVSAWRSRSEGQLHVGSKPSCRRDLRPTLLRSRSRLQERIDRNSHTAYSYCCPTAFQ
jgi:hypothetical protein